MQVIDAGAYTITTGLYHGKEHVYVTHRETGKQWVKKTPHEGEALDGNDFSLANQLRIGTITFKTDRIVGSCDTRFWEAVEVPVSHPRSEWDAMVFIGD